MESKEIEMPSDLLEIVADFTNEVAQFHKYEAEGYKFILDQVRAWYADNPYLQNKTRSLTAENAQLNQTVDELRKEVGWLKWLLKDAFDFGFDAEHRTEWQQFKKENNI